jgi:hypothetical protein
MRGDLPMRVLTCGLLTCLASYLPFAAASVSAQDRSALDVTVGEKNDALSVGQYLVSPNKKYFLIMPGDGNVVIYIGSGPNDNKGHIWASGTHGAIGVYSLALQEDGNLVIYNSEGNPIWNTATVEAGAQSAFIMQDDGNAVLYRLPGPNPRVVWSSRYGYPPAPGSPSGGGPGSCTYYPCGDASHPQTCYGCSGPW